MNSTPDLSVIERCGF